MLKYIDYTSHISLDARQIYCSLMQIQSNYTTSNKTDIKLRENTQFFNNTLRN